MKNGVIERPRYSEFIRLFTKTPPGIVCPHFFLLSHSNGCVASCAYCAEPKTPILTFEGWKELKDISIGDRVLSVDEQIKPGQNRRRLKWAAVEAIRSLKAKAYRVELEDGSFVSSATHRWLRKGGNCHNEAKHRRGLYHWREVRSLKENQKLMFLSPPADPVPLDSSKYQIGYIAGMSLGDGTIRQKKDGKPFFRIALIDREAVKRTRDFLQSLGIVDLKITPFPSAGKPMWQIRTQRMAKVDEIAGILKSTDFRSPNWCKGFVAGFFDAEGSYNKVFRISQKKNYKIKRFLKAAEKLGFRFKADALKPNGSQSYHLLGGIREVIRFFAITNPCIKRKKEALEDMSAVWKMSRIKKIEPVGRKRLIDIQTSTRTFFAGGFASHNCYLWNTLRQLEKNEIFNNYDELERQVKKHITMVPDPTVLNTGELSDSLCWEKRTGFAQRMVELVRGQDLHKVLFLSKFDNVDAFGDIEPTPAAIFSFSVNREDVAALYETGAPEPARRLSAAAFLQAKGWRVRLRIDPMLRLPTEEWSDTRVFYIEFIKKIASLVKPERITLGSLRYFPRLAREAPPESEQLFALAYDQDDPDRRRRYPFKERVKLYGDVIRRIQGMMPGTEVGLCKETERAWDAVWDILGKPDGFDKRNPKCNCGI